MRCPECQVENRAGRRFCAACGAPLTRACAACGFVNEPGERFCGGCGAALAGTQGTPAQPAAGAPSEPTAPGPAEGERRQVTVLFCDLVGYTELTRELGAEATHDLIDRFFGLVDGLIERFGGSVDKHIGDCVMAVFGAPVAHGNDAERAVRTALAIRDALPDLGQQLGRKLDVHIGIASGQVVASGGGSHRRYTVTGESVNLASRLTDAAGTGDILISEAAHRLLADLLECEAPGALGVKGLRQPVNAFRLIGLRAPQRAPAERPFVGRGAELREIEEALRACLDAGQGQTICVRGEAGIGKTRLLEECQKRAAMLGFACHTGLVLDFGMASGHDAIRALALGLLGLHPGSPPDAVARASDAAPRPGLAGADRQVHLNDLLDLPQPVELRALYDAMDPAARNRGRQETLAELVLEASRAKPRLLVIEDLHWADAGTVEQVARLTQTVASCQAVLIMTSRLEGDPLDSIWRARVAGSPLLTLDLGPLRPDEASRLAGAFLDAKSERARRCVDRAAGNPLFLEQLLRHAEETAEQGVPGSVQSLVQARLDHLPPADRQALQAAAVLGQRFSPDALACLLDQPRYDCAPLVRHFLVRPVAEQFLFAHALIRDGVYASLLQGRRAALHRRAAEWFAARDPVLHAEHLDRAGDPGAPAAYLAAASTQAAAYHNEPALALAERGLALAGAGADRFALTCLRGDLLHDLGNMAEARAAYDAALDAAGDDGERCRAWIGLAAVKRVTEDLDGAFADLARAAAAAEPLGLHRELARIHFLRGNLHFPRGEIEACLAAHQRSLAHGRAAGSAELEAAALGGLGDAEYARGRMLTARGHFERCIEVCRRHGFGRIEVASLPMAAITRFYAGEIAAADQDALAAVRAAERVGHQRAAIIACHIVCFTALARGDVAVGRRHVEQALQLSRQLGARRFEAECLWFLADIDRTEGRQDAALSGIRQALRICRESGMSYVGPAILGGVARITDDPAERAAALSEAEQLLAAGSISHNYIWFGQDAIETALEHGDWHGAERYAQMLADYTRAEPLPLIDLVITRGRALAAHGRNPREPAALRALEEARARADALGWLSARRAIDAALATAPATP